MINVIQKRKKSLIGVNYSEYNSEELQNISSTFLENGMHGLCFSPYGGATYNDKTVILL